jgi:hypothetical protein
MTGLLLSSFPTMFIPACPTPPGHESDSNGDGAHQEIEATPGPARPGTRERLALFRRARADARAESFLVEERIRPHPDLAELIGPTLCSVRVVTVVALDGCPRIVGSVYKLQPRPVGVDHLMYGALGCWVDPDTGALGPGRNRAGYEYTSVIPGTDRSFVGYRLPCWNQVKEVVLQAAAVFPWARGGRSG